MVLDIWCMEYMISVVCHMCVLWYIYVYIYIYIHTYAQLYIYTYHSLLSLSDISTCIYIYIWAAEVIWYKTQLTGCSYLVLQSRHVLGGLTSFSNAALVFNSQMLYVRCLPRSRGVPTSFYRLIMIFLTNRGTPQYYSLFNQIKSVAHVYIYIYIYISCVRANRPNEMGDSYIVVMDRSPWLRLVGFKDSVPRHKVLSGASRDKPTLEQWLVK